MQTSFFFNILSEQELLAVENLIRVPFVSFGCSNHSTQYLPIFHVAFTAPKVIDVLQNESKIPTFVLPQDRLQRILVQRIRSLVDDGGVELRHDAPMRKWRSWTTKNKLSLAYFRWNKLNGRTNGRAESKYCDCGQKSPPRTKINLVSVSFGRRSTSWWNANRRSLIVVRNTPFLPSKAEYKWGDRSDRREAPSRIERRSPRRGRRTSSRRRRRRRKMASQLSKRECICHHAEGWSFQKYWKRDSQDCLLLRPYCHHHYYFRHWE